MRASWLLACLLCTSSAAAVSPDFEAEIAPVLVGRCVECHRQPDPAGGLLLTTRDGVLGGGESGSAVDLSSPADSYLLERVHDGEMPPEQQGRPQTLDDVEIRLLEQWIAAGAPWPPGRKLDLLERTTELRAGRDWWSLQPIIKPAIPRLSKLNQPRNAIDAFVLARLEANDMSPAPPADKRTLLRRLYYDLIGLPPTAGQIAAFVNDDDPDAWCKVIDQLLAMPQYGERWARYWLDLARYADTSGYERDQEKLFAWKYRDWVVKAFNDDMRYDQFIIEQIAGDEIAGRSEKSVIATGFMRLGTWNDEPNDPLDYQYDRLEDQVHTTASAFLGLTVKCARCHTHKFDPIAQEDYYRMASAFWAGPIAARDRKWLGGPSAGELGYEDVLGWSDLTANPSPLHLLKNGQREHPMQVIVPASMSLIPSLQREFDVPPEASKSSLRRLQLARWIADPANPLTPRVLVNRLWQHHFGQAIVRTPNNFGFLADPPTHPQLLDWLAAEFIESDGSFKHLHRLILKSQTWRQSSLHPRSEPYRERDSANRLWWRAERRRLDAESLRDSMLTASGELDLVVGGVSFRPTLSPAALEGLSRKSDAWQASPPEDQKRRSIYMYFKRGLLPPMMTAFDLCDATLSCGKRDVTTVPTQALALLNNRFVHERSAHLAALIVASESNRAAQVEQSWLRVLKRRPGERELELSLHHLAVQQRALTSNGASGDVNRPDHERRTPRELALASLCHVLMNSNEFIYID
jgi:hypothetical protein